MDEDQARRPELLDAVTDRNIQRIKELLSRGVSLHEGPLSAPTVALYRATPTGDVEIRRILPREGPVSDATMALYEATQSGDVEICRILLDAGVDPHQKNFHGDTPMHGAVFSGSLEVYRMLRERGADVNVKNIASGTPLHTAAALGHQSLCRELLRDGADIHTRDIYGTQPLMQAAMRSYRSADHMAVCKLLVEHGADVNDRHSDGTTALHHAAYRGDVQLCRFLVERGADQSAESQQGLWGLLTPLQLAVLESQLNVVRYFARECGADLAQRTADGKTLTDLVFYQNTSMLELLASLKQELAASDVAVAEGGTDGANKPSQPCL